jgi:HD-GYP domain-containing protein (c-di-GMP phosphodiesterase class II)
MLAAVDCVDALASDRQYGMLPLDEAMERVAAEAGTSFDSDIVRALQAAIGNWRLVPRPHTDPQPSLSVGHQDQRGRRSSGGL